MEAMSHDSKVPSSNHHIVYNFLQRAYHNKGIGYLSLGRQTVLLKKTCLLLGKV